ncbi:HlyD family secretion protein [Massilia sp. CT11-137]|uniref:HlyD family secretion protein n=1 Tax=Massilia sp. CT11-137 TaxID=3393901 RepID=UPI0039A4C6BE
MARPISALWITVGALFIGAAFVVFIIAGSVTRKARVVGITVPTGGSLSIVAPLSGILVKSMCHEGEYVHTGQVLFELSTERQVGTGEVSEIVSRQLASEERSLDNEQRLRVAQNRLRRQTLQQHLDSLAAEIKHVNEELALAQRRYQLAERSLKQYESLQVSGFMSSAQVQQKQDDLLDLAARVSDVGRNVVQLQSSRRDVEAELSGLDTTMASDLSQLSRAKSSLAREMAENSSRKSLMITARESGILTTITYQVGQAISIGQVLAAMIPASQSSARSDGRLGELEAQLYAPSRAAGFVAPGQEVLIRYQAFPYQKFGLQRGIVSDVSTTPFAPGELPSSLASTILSNAQQNINGFNNNEALYRIKVKLTRQTITTYGKEHPLRPGMTLEADVIQDRRKIWEWIAEPLLAVAYR